MSIHPEGKPCSTSVRVLVLKNPPARPPLKRSCGAPAPAPWPPPPPKPPITARRHPPRRPTRPDSRYGLADSARARHVIGCRLHQEARVQNACHRRSEQHLPALTRGASGAGRERTLGGGGSATRGGGPVPRVGAGAGGGSALGGGGGARGGRGGRGVGAAGAGPGDQGHLAALAQSRGAAEVGPAG